MTIRNSQTYDNLLLLKDAGAVTASGAATVGGTARVLDIGGNTASGSGGARMQAKVVLDVSAADGSDTNETYRVSLQASNDITFGTGVNEIGSVNISNTIGSGREEIHFVNEVANVIFQYVRLYITVGGTTPSINFVGFIAKL